MFSYTEDDLQTFLDGYMDAAELELFDEGLADMSLDCSSVDKAEDVCRLFLSLTRPFLEDLSQAGIDFWLTRNHHGTGFWDRLQNTEYGELLTNISHRFGEACVTYEGSTMYIGDSELPEIDKDDLPLLALAALDT